MTALPEGSSLRANPTWTKNSEVSLASLFTLVPARVGSTAVALYFVLMGVPSEL